MNGIIDNNNKFEWLGSVCKNTKADVTITKAASGNREIACFTFRNEVFKLITSSEYLKMTAPKKGRIYFASGTIDNGFLLGKTNSSSEEVRVRTRYLRIGKQEIANLFFEMQGNFELKFDSYNELYYIEK